MRPVVLRAISRLIGLGLILCAFMLAFILVSVLLTEGWRGSGWTPPVLAVMVIGLFLTGWYYFRTNPDVSGQPTSSIPSTIFLINHRHQLKVLAVTGLGLTLVALGAVCRGNQARWPLWPLGVGALILRSLGSKIADPETTGDRDWQRVPAWLRALFTPAKRTADIAFLLIVAIFAYWNLWRPGSAMEIPGLRFAFQIVLDVEIAFLYGLDLLFFEYGELRTDSPV